MTLSMSRLTIVVLCFFVAACSSTSEKFKEIEQTPTLSQNSRVKGSIDSQYDQSTIIGEAEKHFGKGAEGVATAIEKVFSDLGKPNGYIVGQEGSGSFIVGLKAGDGTLVHAIEGSREVHWIGPSIGLETGGNFSRVFALVYNLYDTEELFERFPAVEGNAYVIGGLSLSYHQRDDIVVVPIRLGVGLRLGANVNYIKFSKDRTYNPF